MPEAHQDPFAILLFRPVTPALAEQRPHHPPVPQGRSHTQALVHEAHCFASVPHLIGLPLPRAQPPQSVVASSSHRTNLRLFATGRPYAPSIRVILLRSLTQTRGPNHLDTHPQRVAGLHHTGSLRATGLVATPALSQELCNRATAPSPTAMDWMYLITILGWRRAQSSQWTDSTAPSAGSSARGWGLQVIQVWHCHSLHGLASLRGQHGGFWFIRSRPRRSKYRPRPASPSLW